MARNRQKTEERILEAAWQILRESGFSSWGVNAIARTAGIDKVLIYRYFGSLDGLLEELLRRYPLWPPTRSLPHHSAEAYLEASMDWISKNPQVLTLLTHPPFQQAANPVSHQLAQEIEQWKETFLEHADGSLPDTAVEMLPALILFQAVTGPGSLSAHRLLKLVAPRLAWQTQPGSPNPLDSGRLPTELL